MEMTRRFERPFRSSDATSSTSVMTHPLTVPRIGYVHSWQRTQDEGWVRAALDRYGVPYTYFADQKLRDGELRSKYDVIVFPSIGGSSVSQVNGIPKTGADAIPYKKTKLTPNLGVEDSSDDIRGGMGIEGLAELVKFVQAGGTLITEGSTTTILPDYGTDQRRASDEFVRKRSIDAWDYLGQKKSHRVWIYGRPDADLLQSGSCVEYSRRRNAHGNYCAWDWGGHHT